MPSLGRATWLMNRMGANERPITDAQVERFGPHPDACVSELCVRMERIPGDEPIFDAAIAPDGTLWYLTTVHRGSGPQFKVRRLDEAKYYLHSCGDGAWEKQIIGFDDEGSPFTCFRLHEDGEGDGPFNHVYRGGECLLSDPKMYTGPTITPKGAVLYVRKSGLDQFSVVKNKREITELAVGRNQDPIRVHELPNGEMVVIYFERDGIGGGMDGRYWVQMVGLKGSALPRIPARHVHVRGQKAYLVNTDTGDSPNEYTEMALRDGELVKDEERVLGRAPYRRGLIHFHNACTAYVCAPTRDRERSEAWISFGAEQPAFERVTDVFEYDGGFRYWGLVGRHAFLMELPTGSRR